MMLNLVIIIQSNYNYKTCNDNLRFQFNNQSTQRLVEFKGGFLCSAAGIRCSDHVTPSIRKSWH
jgi:hypothetical protein